MKLDINYKHSCQLRVRYGETDRMGYCYYGNYAEFLEVGRVEAIRSKGITYKKLEEDGIMLPVLEFQIKYLAPAKYDDLLKIVTYISHLNGSRLYFTYEIFNEENKKLAEASTTLVFVKSETMKPTIAPDLFVSAITTDINQGL
jgi:acyl-CoA thioester hydrolase